jgi:hypothetical protein
MNHGRGLRARSNRWLVESLHRRIQGGKPWSGRAPRIQHEALGEGFHPIVRGRFLRQGKIFRNREGEAGRPLDRPPSPLRGVFDRLFLSGLLASRARLRFTGWK